MFCLFDMLETFTGIGRKPHDLPEERQRHEPCRQPPLVHDRDAVHLEVFRRERTAGLHGRQRGVQAQRSWRQGVSVFFSFRRFFLRIFYRFVRNLRDHFISACCTSLGSVSL